MMKAKALYSTALAAFCSLALAGQPQAAEFQDNTPYYEDDGWFDITEWFDGNDYNPTDETWWRWDDEKYDPSQDTGSDRDSDGWYGYTRGGNDWYYDYYDPSLYTSYDRDGDEVYEHGARFHDFDQDGFYDAISSYSDLDGNGFYDDYEFFTFTDQSERKPRPTQQQMSRSSRAHIVTGEVQKTKLVQVRGGEQHLVVSIKPQQGRESIVADLGRARTFKTASPKLGDKITVSGPTAQVGKQSVLLARSVSLNGKEQRIDREPRSITARIVDTRKARVAGQDHVIAMVQPSQQGGNQKMAVDLGPANLLNIHLDKGTTLTFRGFPVKVKGKPLLMAQAVKKGDRFVQINRRPQQSGAERAHEN